MKKLNQKKAIALTLAAGIAILSTAAVAGAISANGYGVYKKAVRSWVNARNYTSEMTFTASVDGQLFEQSSVYQQLDLDGDVKVMRKNTYDDTVGDQYWHQDGMTIQYYPRYNDGENVYYQYMIDDVNNRPVNDMFGFADTDAHEVRDKFMNFAELCADLVIGDMKNNFVMTGHDDSGYSYELTLEGIQIPEIVNAGTALITSMNSANYSDNEQSIEEIAQYDPMVYFTENSQVSAASCFVTVDNDGNLVENELSVTVTGQDTKGNVHSLVFAIRIQNSDFGTTVVDRLDLDAIPDSHKEYQSQWRDKRIKEIEISLQEDDLSEEIRENYQIELEHLRSATEDIAITTEEAEISVDDAR